MMQMQFAPRFVPMVSRGPHSAPALPEQPPMKYYAKQELTSQASSNEKRKEKTAELSSSARVLCAAADEARESMRKAQEECDAAEARLREYQRELEEVRAKALRAERDADTAVDDLKELEDSVSLASIMIDTASPEEKQRIQEKIQQARLAVENSHKQAAHTANLELQKRQGGEVFKIEADFARSALANRTAEYTLAVCRAACTGADGRLEEMSTMLDGKFEHQFSGEDDLLYTSAPMQVMFTRPVMAPAQQRLYSSQTAVPTRQVVRSVPASQILQGGQSTMPVPVPMTAQAQ